MPGKLDYKDLTEKGGSFEYHENPGKFFSTILLGEEEDNCNVETALPRANPITSPSLQKSMKLTIQNRVVNQEEKYRGATEKPLPFIFNS